MAKKISLLTLIILFATIIYSQKADDIIGKYRLPNKLDVEIFKENNQYFGKVIALNGWEDGKTTDYKNPDKTKQNDLIIGKKIISGLVFDNENKEWVNGNMYGPEKGMFFNLKVTDIREEEIEVVGSKYLFWHTLEWKKI